MSENTFAPFVEFCPYCDNEAEGTYRVDNDEYVGVCDHCKQEIHICGDCMLAEDNPSEKCDWHIEVIDGVKYSVCFRSKIKYGRVKFYD